MTTNEKPLSASLFAFNNRIVSMKPIIKKSKILVIRKLTRQINVFKNKKGNDKQIAKNQRKAQKLKDEILIIKKLKFNDIAIYCMENETKFDQVIKSKPNIDLNEKSLAKISLHKLIVNEINKLKESEKDWKKILIQYKSRIEKKRSWKEKQKFHKEIEEGLTKLQENIVNENDDDGDSKVEQASGEEKTEIKEKKVKIEEIKNYVNNNNDSENDTLNDNDDEDRGGEDDDSSIDIDMNSNGEENFEIKSESDKESIQNDDDNNKESDIELKPAKKFKKEIINNSINFEVKTNYKPRVNINSKEMVIKQIVLDELSNLDEIPINGNNNENDNKIPNDSKQMKTTTISDPFFLSANGGSHIVDTSNARIDESVNNNYEDDDFYDNRKFKNLKHLNSSFTNLSRDRKQQYKYDDHDDYRNKFNRKTNNNNYDFNNKFNKNDDRNGYRNFDNMKTRQSERSRPFMEKSRSKPEEDTSNLHPSWKAKKEQEEKQKTLKFQGTKMKFDDDDDDGANKKHFIEKSKPKLIEDSSNLHPSWKAKREQEEKLKALKFQGTKLKFDDDE